MARLGQVRKGRGRKPSIPQETIEEILDLTQNYRPQGQTHWLPDDGRGGRSLKGHSAARVVGTRLEAASGRDVQAIQRSPIRREARRRGRAVCEPAGKGHRVVR